MRSFRTSGSGGSEVGVGVELGVGLGVLLGSWTLMTPVMEACLSQTNVYVPATVNVRDWPFQSEPGNDGTCGYAGPSAKWKLWPTAALGSIVKVTVSPTWMVTSSGSKKRSRACSVLSSTASAGTTASATTEITMSVTGPLHIVRWYALPRAAVQSQGTEAAATSAAPMTAASAPRPAGRTGRSRASGS